MPTEPADRVLNAIVRLTRKQGFPPTVREIGDAVGLSSTSTVQSHLDTLVRQKRITRRKGSARTIQVVDSPSDRADEYAMERRNR